VLSSIFLKGEECGDVNHSLVTTSEKNSQQVKNIELKKDYITLCKTRQKGLQEKQRLEKTRILLSW
jgi:hypothetical protein